MFVCRSFCTLPFLERLCQPSLKRGGVARCFMLCRCVNILIVFLPSNRTNNYLSHTHICYFLSCTKCYSFDTDTSCSCMSLAYCNCIHTLDMNTKARVLSPRALSLRNTRENIGNCGYCKWDTCNCNCRKDTNNLYLNSLNIYTNRCHIAGDDSCIRVQTQVLEKT